MNLNRMQCNVLQGSTVHSHHIAGENLNTSCHPTLLKNFGKFMVVSKTASSISVM